MIAARPIMIGEVRVSDLQVDDSRIIRRLNRKEPLEIPAQPLCVQDPFYCQLVSSLA